MKPRVFVSRRLPESALEIASSAADLDIWPDELPPAYSVLVERTAPCEGLLCLLTDRIDAGLLERAPRLRVVSQMAVGFDNIDVAACAARGILVGNTPGVLGDTTADFAFALLMAAARRVVEADRFLRSGQWKTWGPMLLAGQDVFGKTLGIVGMGDIGQRVARRGAGYGMRVVYTGPAEVQAPAGCAPWERMELRDLLGRSDFVSLHVPLSPQTRRLIGEAELRLMKPTAILVNTARGAVVDQAALVAALQAGWIAGAGLDVFEQEPLSPESPLIAMPNVVLAPHIASASVETRSRMAILAVQNLIAGLEGRPLPHAV